MDREIVKRTVEKHFEDLHLELNMYIGKNASMHNIVDEVKASLLEDLSK